MTAIFGNGLLTSEGDFWLKQRRQAAPAFHPDRIAAYGSVMSEFTDRLAGGWREGETRDIHRDLMRVTMEIVSKTLFDVEVAEDVEEIGSAFDVLIGEIAARFRRPDQDRGLGSDSGQRCATGEASRGSSGSSRACSRSGERLPATGETCSRCSWRRVMTTGIRCRTASCATSSSLFFWPGTRLTAISLSWTLFLLAKNPDVDAALDREIRDVLDGRIPGAADLPRLKVAGSVVREALRLYPPAYAVGREAVEDCTIGGYRIPAKSTIYFSPWSLHRDERWFEDAESFRPSRWMDGSTARVPKYAYIPFGGGPRICIGERFAMMEAVLVLVTILRRFRLEMAGPDPKPFPSITLRPKGGPTMRVSRRADS